MQGGVGVACAAEGRRVGNAEFDGCLAIGRWGERLLHYITNSLIISRIIRLEQVVDYQPDYQPNYQPDYQPGSTEVPAW